jgi:tRNA threonylcarbamoyladenosine biosynthesis protein TsaE
VKASQGQGTLRGRSGSAGETRALGRALGARLGIGDWLGLTGELGAGKTCLVQGLAQGLGVPEDHPVVSPTFVLLHTYPGRLPLHHLDLYRLQGASELEELGYDELSASGALAVEWFEQVPDARLADGLVIELGLVSTRVRTWEARALGPRGRELLAALADFGGEPRRRGGR